METNLCPVCKTEATKRCGGCGNVVYCNKEHQRQHWRTHKPDCKMFRVDNNSMLGRHLLATRDIKLGEVVIGDTPLLRGPLVNSSPVCLACLKSISPGNSSPCHKCGWPLCLKDACRNSREHLPECEWRRKQKKGLPAAFIMDYKVVTILRLCYARCNQPKLWARLSRLENHTEKRLHTNKYQYGEKIIVRTLRANYHLEELTDDEIFDMLGIFAVNGQEVVGPEEHYIAVYYMPSLIEHSCFPNCSVTFTPEGEITIRAGLDILKGDHISVCYTDMNWGTTSRYQHLLLNSYFSCSCIRCTDNTEMGTYYSAILCQASGCGGSILPENLCDLAPATLWTCMSCGIAIPNVVVEELLDAIKEDLNELDHRFSELLKFTKKWKSRLHPNHYYLIAAKITWGFGPGLFQDPKNLSDDFLLVGIEWYRHLCDLLPIIAPVELKARSMYKSKLFEFLLEKSRRLVFQGKLSERDALMSEASTHIEEASKMSTLNQAIAGIHTKTKLMNRYLSF